MVRGDAWLKDQLEWFFVRRTQHGTSPSAATITTVDVNVLVTLTLYDSQRRGCSRVAHAVLQEYERQPRLISGCRAQ